jgi:hypothetical protein
VDHLCHVVEVLCSRCESEFVARIPAPGNPKRLGRMKIGSTVAPVQATRTASLRRLGRNATRASGTGESWDRPAARKMDGRAYKRVVVDLDVAASVGTRSMSAMIYGLSMDGCLIEACGGPMPAASSAINLYIASVKVTRGSLMWTKGNLAKLVRMSAMGRKRTSYRGLAVLYGIMSKSTIWYSIRGLSVGTGAPR